MDHGHHPPCEQSVSKREKNSAHLCAHQLLHPSACDSLTQRSCVPFKPLAGGSVLLDRQPDGLSTHTHAAVGGLRDTIKGVRVKKTHRRRTGASAARQITFIKGLALFMCASRVGNSTACGHQAAVEAVCGGVF